MNEPEIYLIVIWQKSGLTEKKINQIVSQQGFEVTLTSAILPENQQLSFIKRLYYNSVTNFRRKIQRVGLDQFTVGIVKDDKPDYGILETSRGYSKVNRRIVGLKKVLRAASKIQDGVHLSDTRLEAEHNLFITFSKSYEELEESYQNLNFDPKEILNIEDLFSILNVSTPYVVQRNFHEIFDRSIAEHGDIDLLVEDTQATAFLIDAKPATNDPSRKLYAVPVGSKSILFDLRDCQENYYPPSWANDILRNRMRSTCGTFYKPSEEDIFYMVAYHALFHKHELKDDYLKFLTDHSCGLTDRTLSDWSEILSSLCRFLSKRKYDITIPEDKTVKLNPFHYILSNLSDTRNITRETFIPEHHARRFVEEIKAKPVFLYQKSNKLADVSVLSSNIAPLNMLVCKIVNLKDLNYAPYILNEYSQLKLYGNSHAPKVFSYFYDNGSYHILMEKIIGRTLDYLLEKKPNFLIKNRDAILMGLTSAENLLCVKCIQHRDIRETNIFITPKAEVKLIDFGLSCSAYDKQALIPSALKYSGNDQQDFGRIKLILENL